MIYKVYAIRDQKSGRFMIPNCDVNDETAKRGFAQAVNSDMGIVGFAPGDFDLYQIAEFDDQNGLFKPNIVVELVCNGAQLVFRKEVKDNEM